MEGKHPKRRKDKYNPYQICENNGYYYISFVDGQGDLQEFEIPQWLHDTLDSFELDDLVYLNVWDRHIEQSEVWESTLNMRAIHKPESIEDMIIRNFEYEQLYSAIKKLPEKQRRRLLLHYFDGMTYVEISKMEKCSTRAVEYSIHNAIQNLKKYLKKF